MAALYHRRVFEAALMLSGDGKDLRNILAIIRVLMHMEPSNASMSLKEGRIAFAFPNRALRKSGS